jgi:hypothetical protein
VADKHTYLFGLLMLCRKSGFGIGRKHELRAGDLDDRGLQPDREQAGIFKSVGLSFKVSC